MEKRFFSMQGYCKAFLQIGQNYSLISMSGAHSYGVCGKNVILFLVDVDNEVVGLVLKGGYINRVNTYELNGVFCVCVEVFTRQSGANPNLVTEDFSYELVDVL